MDVPDWMTRLYGLADLSVQETARAVLILLNKSKDYQSCLLAGSDAAAVAFVRALLVETAPPPPQVGSYERFVSFLEPPVRESVLNRAVAHFPNHILAVGTREQAIELFNRAARFPGSSTKLNLQQQHGLIINGDFLPNVVTKSSLSYAFLHGKPMLLKVPAMDQAAAHEANVWKTLSQRGAPPNLAGPIQLYELKGSEGTRQGILMPLYPVTMQHMPCLTESHALRLGKQLHGALTHMHSLQLAHCDIKSPNIFIDTFGDAHLGDFGATRNFGEDADEKTFSHVPVDAFGKLNVDKASPDLDFFLLAVTLMERLGWLELGKSQLTISKVATSMGNATTGALRDFLVELLRSVL
mmetsp:Transcript_34720/g.77198  ORF Transcript_34720/g.77198 Transcript_34720/m.77198 type:complete len:354 (-) Transcript_34720:883-1944(-)